MAKFSLALVISFSLLLFASAHHAATKTSLPCKIKGLYWSGPFPGISDNPHGAPPGETTKRLLHVVPVKPPNTQSKTKGMFQTAHKAPPTTKRLLHVVPVKTPNTARKAKGLFQTSRRAPPAETTNSFLYSQPVKPPNVASKTETLF
ncbi:hypothetical protein HID58_008138 [Brassica napus]|uniref:Uncharacterized protein n=2 Tax=Brassica TaxID=3705 RepID=A0A3P6A1X6_BRACM|nr:hypothetical protein HID58_008138 [Brassica napus]CAF2118219.1 unnamed protein product [Brassica napus]CAG7878744.1 unnamed protein product [Brassica rapa]VDC78248.1 unnamed protein product [Brassica rapa]